ncbi:MAG: ABC transporter substrate-binding protein, partial [Lachnospiraceae bacterium]|nr:ABC transporter substrate-binding protein [Lachnospiraceae bacterium]
TYLAPDEGGEDENALSTVNMQLENFYMEARDADILIYNSTVAGELETMDDFLKISPLLADFKAVETGDVGCTEQNMFQQVSGTAEMIEDLHAVIGGGDGEIEYLHRLS